MRGGLTIDIYIPKDILQEPERADEVLLVHWRQSDCVSAAGYVCRNVRAVVAIRDAIPIPECRLRPCTSRQPGFLPRKRARCSTTRFIRATLHRPSSIWRCADTSRSKRHPRRRYSSRTRITSFTCSSRAISGEVTWLRTSASCSRIFSPVANETRLSSLKNRFYTTVPIIRQDIMAALKTKGIYLLDPESANGYSIGSGRCDSCFVCAFSAPGLGELLQLRASAGSVHSAVGADLVAVCTSHDRQNSEGRAGTGRGARLSGIHESRGCGPVEGHAADYVRKVSAVCDGAGRGASLGAGVCGDREGSVRNGTWGRGRMLAGSIRFSFRVP